jgi:hypothetical protein
MNIVVPAVAIIVALYVAVRLALRYCFSPERDLRPIIVPFTSKSDTQIGNVCSLRNLNSLGVE